MHGATVRHNAALALLRLCADPSGGSPSLPTRFLPVETRRTPHGQTLTLRAMAQLKRTEPYQVLFASESYVDYLRRTRALDRLLESDRARIQDFRDRLETWEASRRDLGRRRDNLTRTGATISNLSNRDERLNKKF